MYSAIYWITRLDGIIIFLSVLVGICLVSGLFLIISIDCSFHDDEAGKKKKWKWVRKLLVAAAIGGGALVFIPSRNDAILIYAGGKTYEYIKKDTSLQKLPFQATEYLNLVFDKEIEKLKKESK